MKCTCPMGGDRTCPDDCPLAIWAGMSKADRKTQRKIIAERLFKQGFMQDQIATQLGVSQRQISRDLFNLDIASKSKPTKTARNPKGAGRPKGSGTARKRKQKSGQDERVAAAALVLDHGLSRVQVKEQTGLGEHEVQLAVEHERGRREVEPEVTRDMLTMSAQQKFDVALRRYKASIFAEFHRAVADAVADKVKDFVDSTIIPDWRKKIDQAHKLYNSRVALMKKEMFNKIRRALHPDSRNSISDRMLGEAFDGFMALEKFLLNEKDSPTLFGETLPKGWDEWETAKRKASDNRKSKHYAGAMVRKG